MTGERTGRSPADRFIVENALTRDRVDWGAINKPFPSDDFERILEKAAEYIKGLDEVFVVDAYAGADPRYRLNVHIVTEWAWHALFVRQLFRRPSPEELESFEPTGRSSRSPGSRRTPRGTGRTRRPSSGWTSSAGWSSCAPRGTPGR